MFIKNSLRRSLSLELNMEADRCSSGLRKRPHDMMHLKNYFKPECTARPSFKRNRTSPNKTTNALSSSRCVQWLSGGFGKVIPKSRAIREQLAVPQLQYYSLALN